MNGPPLASVSCAPFKRQVPSYGITWPEPYGQLGLVSGSSVERAGLDTGFTIVGYAPTGCYPSLHLVASDALLVRVLSTPPLN